MSYTQPSDATVPASSLASALSGGTLDRAIFVATILTGSILLFLVQPMVARMALPALGGAPAVWNSAMLVYQSLLLAGYAYAHAISFLPLRRQALIHLAVLAVAGMTLPLALADLPAPWQGWEVAWVPLLFLASIGPVFFAVSAQAPLMQSWYAADKRAGDPYWLYAASNLGSFGGLIAYPILLEPNFTLEAQSFSWSAGYFLLFALVVLAAIARWNSVREGAIAVRPVQDADAEQAEASSIGFRRIAMWLALAAVPSGLMLSTTTHLTTDMVAMPLLWVIPLGLYLLSFVFAFNEASTLARWIARIAPLVLLLGGSIAMGSYASGTMLGAIASVVLLFAVAVALHRRLYEDRPPAAQLTFFYLMMSLGGALGGLFTALIAPAVFDWVWEHPLLVLAAAALLPRESWLELPERVRFLGQHRRIIFLAVTLGVVIFSAISFRALAEGAVGTAAILILLATFGSIFLFAKRGLFVGALLFLMLGHGGFATLAGSFNDLRERSFFGIYAINAGSPDGVRRLTHGTTIHGLQFNDEARELEPTAYYGRTSGVGLALANANDLVGADARVGIVGLGVGTLACYRAPDQSYEFFEIDPAILRYSEDGTFTFISECAPSSPTHIGDARVVLEQMEDGRYDVLVIDAFTSDAIPLHLLTTEAFEIYSDRLAEGGVLLVHISNRFIELAPMLAALADANGLEARLRQDPANEELEYTSSTWIALSSDAAQLRKLETLSKHEGKPIEWEAMPEASKHVWTDDFASILPFLRWENVL